MTVEKQGDVTIVHCDFCPSYMEIECDDPEITRAEIKEAGWRFQKDKNDCWENVCSVCIRVPGVAKW